MKQTKKLTYIQKRKLSSIGIDARKYRYVEEDKVAWLLVNDETKETIWVPKE